MKGKNELHIPEEVIFYQIIRTIFICLYLGVCLSDSDVK